MRKFIYLLGVVLALNLLVFSISCNKNSGISEMSSEMSQTDNSSSKLIDNNLYSKDNSFLILGDDLSSQRIGEINEMMLSKDFKLIHDKYSMMICDSVQVWRRYNMLDSTICDNVWDMIVNGLTEDLGLSKEEIVMFADTIGMSKQDYYIFEPKSWISQIPQNWQLFYTDVTQSVRGLQDLSDDNILNLLEEKRLYWRSILDPVSVDKTIDVAKSSYIHWINNVDCLVDSEFEFRNRKHDAGIGLAEDDIGSAIWGGIFGGLAGACLGAVGGTLVGAIKLAIHGY